MRDDTTSLSLIDRARQRDAAAWSRLVYLYGPLMEFWCRGWGLDESDFEDVKQEVFQAVATGLDRFRRDRPGDSFRGWLHTIARNKFVDYCRRKQHLPDAQGGSAAHRRWLQVPAAETAVADDPPEEMRRLHHRALELVRGEFEVRTWQAFWQCAVEDKSPLDVGKDMGMTPAAVRKAKSRVLHRLKQELGDLLG